MILTYPSFTFMSDMQYGIAFSSEYFKRSYTLTSFTSPIQLPFLPLLLKLMISCMFFTYSDIKESFPSRTVKRYRICATTVHSDLDCLLLLFILNLMLLSAWLIFAYLIPYSEVFITNSRYSKFLKTRRIDDCRLHS